MTLENPAANDMRFAVVVDEQRMVIDSDPKGTIPSPVQTLLVSLAACGAMDVIGILRKKRQRVTAYEVTFRGERAPEHPKRFTEIEIVHVVTGHDVNPAAVAEAIRLSDEKYCSVHHSLRPDILIRTRHEVRPA
jgi:putative redox protein